MITLDKEQINLKIKQINPDTYRLSQLNRHLNNML